MSTPITVNGITWERHLIAPGDIKEHVLIGHTERDFLEVSMELQMKLNVAEFWGAADHHLKVSCITVDDGSMAVYVLEMPNRTGILSVYDHGKYRHFNMLEAVDYGRLFPTIEQLPAEELADFKAKPSLPLKQETWRDRPAML